MGRPQRFRGVRQRRWGSWVSEFRHPITKRRVWVGTFESAEEAALAYDNAARFVGGIHANTNFPFQPSSLYFIPPLLKEKLKHSMHYDILSPPISKIRKSSYIVNDSRYRANGFMDSPRYVSFSCWMNEGDKEEEEEEEEEAPNPNPFPTNNKKDSSIKVSREEDSKSGHGEEMVLEMMKELLNCVSNSDAELSLLTSLF